jgi:hypothetical protein
MRKALILSAVSFALIAVVGCHKNKSNGEMMHQPTTMQAMMYTCPMHPEVVQDTPGKCPKCGSNLVAKK